MYVNDDSLLKAADKYHYAQGAFNVNTLEQVDAAIRIHEIMHAPLLLQGAQLGNAFLGGRADFGKGTIEDIRKGAQLLADYVKDKAEKTDIPVVLHLDHGKSFDVVKACVDAGYSSAMIDGSSLPYDENVALTKKCVDYAHKFGVTVEGELGVIAGQEDHVFAKNSTYTNPLQALDFVKKTGVDSLAISYGTKHGPNKGHDIRLRMQVVTAVKEIFLNEGLDTNIVSHGSSTVPKYIVEDNNRLGGNVDGSGGIPIDQLQTAIQCGVNKINIDSDIRLATTRNLRQLGVEHPEVKSDPCTKHLYELMDQKKGEIDPRQYLEDNMGLVTTNKPRDDAEELVNLAFHDATQEIMGQLIVQFGMLGKAWKVKDMIK